MAESAVTASGAELPDIQGLVRYAHGQLPDSAFLLLRVNDIDAAKRWILQAPVTDACECESPPDRALQLAFTAAGLSELGFDESLLQQFSEEFTDGMAGNSNRSRRLGDTGENAPAKWDWGGTSDTLPHLLLMLYARSGELQSLLDTTCDDLFEQAFDVQLPLLSKGNGPREPFGFADGISQPDIDWRQTQSTDLHERDAFANRTSLGEFLLGYSNEYGLYTERPLLQDTATDDALPVAEEQRRYRDLGRNGTYLVFRQLSQNVPEFWQYIDSQADGDATERDRLAAAMVGRQRNGEPLLPVAREPIDGIDTSDHYNHFNYDDDPRGLRCPIGAHVRRANPRTGDFPVGVDGLLTRLIRTLGFGRRHDGDDLVASTRFHRLLRRGRIYGSEISIEEALQSLPDRGEDIRGLYFICLGANISRQFEFVQNAWNMSAKFAGLPTESDPLLGNRKPLIVGQATDHFSLPQKDAPARCLQGLPRFVTVRGGAYFFMPGIRALRYIASR